MPESNAVHLDFNWRTTDSAKADVRANAVFIHAKLVSAGMDVKLAKEAVEKLFSDGRAEGYEDGYESGYDQSSDEFNK